MEIASRPSHNIKALDFIPTTLLCPVSAVLERAAVVLLGTMCLFAPKPSAVAQPIMVVGDSAYRPAGLFCFNWVSNRVTDLHLVKVRGEKVETLFSKTMPGSMNAPICYSNAVVAVSTEGVINKFNLQGESVFSTSLQGFAGPAWGSGRLTDSHIFLIELTHSTEKKDWVFFLWIVDISGTKPVVKSKLEIIRPLRVLHLQDQILIIGEKDVQRLPSP